MVHGVMTVNSSATTIVRQASAQAVNVTKPALHRWNVPLTSTAPAPAGQALVVPSARSVCLVTTTSPALAVQNVHAVVSGA